MVLKKLRTNQKNANSLAAKPRRIGYTYIDMKTCLMFTLVRVYSVYRNVYAEFLQYTSTFKQCRTVERSYYG